jgi:predicted lipoprotein with Yx(FWY)xxD motif
VKKSLSLAVAGSALALALAGCSGSDTPKAPAAGLDAATIDSSLGEIVVDGKGMTAYVFDDDAPGSGKSACTGECAQDWHAITADTTTPKVDGITGEVATIMGADGGTQITIEGLPIYTYEGDSKIGQLKGQGVDDMWHVVSPSGKKITEEPVSNPGGGGY